MAQNKSFSHLLSLAPWTRSYLSYSFSLYLELIYVLHPLIYFAQPTSAGVRSDLSDGAV